MVYYRACKLSTVDAPICFNQGLPEINVLEDIIIIIYIIRSPTLVVIDDLIWQKLIKVWYICLLKAVTIYNISVFYLTNNIFHQGRE